MDESTLDATHKNRTPRYRGQPRSPSHLNVGLRRFVSRPVNIVAMGFLVLGMGMALVPTSLLPHDPTRIDVMNRLKPPSLSFVQGAYPLGTDMLGRDVLSRIIFAAKWTFQVTISAALLACVVGTLAGLTAGYVGGWVDVVLSRLMDMQLAFPAVLLAITVLAVAGPSTLNMIFVLGVVDWARYGRVIRAVTMTHRSTDYVESARALGAAGGRVVFTHILPNVSSSIIVMVTYSTALLLLTESALSFLGLGISPPAVTWGGMIGSGRDYIYQAWWIATVPGVVTTLTVLAINFVGDGLTDAFDPRGR